MVNENNGLLKGLIKVICDKCLMWQITVSVEHPPIISCFLCGSRNIRTIVGNKPLRTKADYDELAKFVGESNALAGLKTTDIKILNKKQLMSKHKCGRKKGCVAWNKGKTMIFTDEHRKNLSNAGMGHEGYWLGKKMSKEHRANMSKSKKLMMMSEEIRKRLSEACKNAKIVHHINGNHDDNRPENRMFVTPREHAIIHINQGDIKPYGGRKSKHKLHKEAKNGNK